MPLSARLRRPAAISPYRSTRTDNCSSAFGSCFEKGGHCQESRSKRSPARAVVVFRKVLKPECSRSRPIAGLSEDCGPSHQPAECSRAFRCEFDATRSRLCPGRIYMGRQFGTGPRFTESRRGAVVVVQHAAQAPAPLDYACLSKMAHLWVD